MRCLLAFLVLNTALGLGSLSANAADAGAANQPSSTRVISYADVKQQLAQPGNVTILDLRRNSDYDKDTLTMPGARRLDPDKIAEWAGTLPKDKEIVLFCAHGRSISNASVDHLTKAGYKARLVPGGFDSWKEAGGATAAKPQ
jgi:Fe-Mn family superoxide dismutase